MLVGAAAVAPVLAFSAAASDDALAAVYAAAAGVVLLLIVLLFSYASRPWAGDREADVLRRRHPGLVACPACRRCPSDPSTSEPP